MQPRHWKRTAIASETAGILSPETRIRSACLNSHPQSAILCAVLLPACRQPL